jgi:hypothetical protein
MRLSELIVAINSLKWDIEQWKIEKENEEYYNDVLSEVQTILINLDR